MVFQSYGVKIFAGGIVQAGSQCLRALLPQWIHIELAARLNTPRDQYSADLRSYVVSLDCSSIVKLVFLKDMI